MDKEQLLQQINQLYQQQNWQAMLQLCDQGLKYYPNDASLYYNKAFAKASLGYFLEAKSDLEKVLEIKPDEQNAKQFLLQINKKLDQTYHKSSTRQSEELSPSQLFEQNKDDLIQLFEEPSPPEKKQFGRYQIVEELGRGGMGKVYKAYDEQLDRFVALKVIISGDVASKKEIDRFMREAKATAGIKHPNIVSVYDIGIEDGCPYFTMDLVEGMSLKEYLQKAKRDIRKIIKIMIKVGNAIHYAHGRGIIHRDIKPANIMITQDVEPLVMDFGLAKVTTDEQLSKTGDVIGTPAYMSPEQAQSKEVDKTTDVYALGATLYEILTGRPPFQGETYFNIVKQILEDDPISPRSLNPEMAGDLEAICLKCLEKKAVERYQSTKELVEDLTNFLEDKPVVAKPPTRRVLIYKWIARNKLPVLAASLIFLALLCGGVIALIQRNRAIDAEKEAKKQKREIKIRLAKITFSKAKEAKLWEKTGAYAGCALESIKDEENIDSLKEKYKNLIRLALHKKDLFWKSENRISTKTIAYSPDGKFIASGSSDMTVRVWDPSSGKQVHSFAGHTHHVNSIAYSPDGKFIASGSQDKTVRVWDLSSGKQVQSFTRHTNRINSIAYSPNGKFIASGSQDKTVRVWDLSSGKQVHSFTRHTKWVNSIAYSPDGKFIASGSKDKTVRVWDLSSGKQVHSFTRHTKWVNSIAYSPDGKFIASGSGDKTVRVWDLSSGKQVHSFGHTDIINSIAYSPDGKFIASGSSYGAVKIWDLSSGKQVRSFTGHTDIINSIAYSPDGKFIASSSSYGALRIWDLSSGKQIHSFTGLYGSSIAYSPDGKFIASGSGDKTVRVWDPSSGKQVHSFGHTHYVNSIAYSPDGKFIASGSSTAVKIWDLSSGKQVHSFGHTDIINSIAYSPDGKFIASGSSYGTVKIWDLSSGKQVHSFARHIGSVNSIAYSPDGKFIASGSEDKTVKVWELSSGKQAQSFGSWTRSVAYSPDGKFIAFGSSYGTVIIRDISSGKQVLFSRGHTSIISSIAYSPDGKFLASGSEDKTVRVWDLSSGKQVQSFTGHTNINSIAYSPDGKFIAFGLGDQTVRVWGLSGKQVQFFTGHTNINSIAYSPDGKFIASGSTKTVRVWDLSSGKQVHSFTGQFYRVNSIAYSPDGKFIAFGSSDETVRVWGLSGKQVRSFTGHTGWVKSIAYSPGSKFIASGSEDKTVRVWDLSSGKQAHSFAGHTGSVNSVAYSPDGKFIASSSSTTVRIWDLSSGKQVQSFTGHTNGINSIVYSPDGKFIASGSTKTVKVWDLSSRKQVHSFIKDINRINSIVYSPDGKFIASGSTKTVKVWDLSSGKQIHSFTGHTHQVSSVAYSPDGKFIASGSKDRTVRIWEVGRKFNTFKKEFFFNSDKKQLAFTTKNNHVHFWDITGARLTRITTLASLQSHNWQKLQKTYTTKWDYKTNIPVWVIEFALEKEPQKFTQALFGWEITEDLSIKKYDPQYLWGYTIDPNIPQVNIGKTESHQNHQKKIVKTQIKKMQQSSKTPEKLDRNNVISKREKAQKYYAKQKKLKRTIQHTKAIKTKNVPVGWPFKLWQKCWKKGWVDFTIDDWVRLTAKEQVEYAKYYQYWYARKYMLKVEDKFDLGKTKMDAMLIPPGKFYMGSLINEKGRRANEKRHKVLINKPFWMGKYEVTQEQWNAVVKTKYKSPWENQEYVKHNPKHPAVFLDWFTIEKEFINPLQQKGYACDFPTEAQWEYACRAGSTKRFYWGESEKAAEIHANFLDLAAKRSKTFQDLKFNKKRLKDGYVTTAPVGSFKKNGFGLHDMSGNVLEWCKDFYQADYPGITINPLRKHSVFVDEILSKRKNSLKGFVLLGFENPKKTKITLKKSSSTPKEMAPRVLRGGSFFHPTKGLRASARYWLMPVTTANIGLGLRLVFTKQNKKNLDETYKLKQKRTSLKKSKTNNKKEAETYFFGGAKKSSLGKLKEAMESYNKSIELNPGYAKAYYYRGKLKSAQGNLKGAMEDYNKSIELNPKQAFVYSNRGVLKWSQGNLLEAIEDYNKAIELNPKYAHPHVGRGGVRVKQGNLKEAIKDFTKAIELAPRYADAYKNRGIVFMKQNLHKKAAKDFDKYLRLKPSAPESRQIRAYIAKHNEKK